MSVGQRAESLNDMTDEQIHAIAADLIERWSVKTAHGKLHDFHLREALEAAAQARAGESADRTCWHCGAGAMPEHFKYCYMCGSDIDRAANPSAPTQTGAAGEWVMVPRDPTDSMLDDGHESLVEGHKTGTYTGACPGHTWGDSGRCYRAMIAAAPAPPVSAELTGQMLMAAMNAHFASCDAEMCACYTRPHHMRPALEAALAARQQPSV
jgi:hypothetical protein